MASLDDEELERLYNDLSRVTGIPAEKFRKMTQEQLERAVIGDDLGPPEEGEYTEIYPNESNQ
jgi:hypothetical protein